LPVAKGNKDIKSYADLMQKVKQARKACKCAGESGVVKKKNTSSFFPKNWDIKRVKQEIALVYDEMMKSGRTFPYENNKFFFFDSTKSFEIQIELISLGI